jgi:hypothetical protein
VPIAAEMPARMDASPEPSTTANVQGDSEAGVEVASVDFGSQAGSVFYVTGDDNAAMTTVVWINDAGGDLE